MTLEEKIRKIISAIKSDISIYKIDPIGKGCSAKMLIEGKMPTQKKILQMYTNVLVIEKEKQITVDSESEKSQDNSDYIVKEQLRLRKMQVILEAANSGIAHSVIDPTGNGGSIRRLLRGSSSKPEKIDQMYENVIDYQQKQILQKKEQFVIVNPHENPDNDKKKSLILQAVESGIQKCKIDTSGGGKAIRRLQDGKGVVQVTLDMMYSNLLTLMGYASESPDTSGARQSYATLQNQITSLQNVVASLVDTVNLLQTAVSVLQKEIQPSTKNTPHKILGTTIMLKDDIIRGKKYHRWYALYLDHNNKRRWIYIGVNVSKAKDKILAWFARHPQDLSKGSSYEQI